jgi:hypothetical protein
MKPAKDNPNIKRLIDEILKLCRKEDVSITFEIKDFVRDLILVTGYTEEETGEGR